MLCSHLEGGTGDEHKSKAGDHVWAEWVWDGTAAQVAPNAFG